MADYLTDELPEYAARCPSLRKKELIYSVNIFDEVDKKALEVSKLICFLYLIFIFYFEI